MDAGALPALADDIFLTEQTPTEYLAKDRLIGVNVHNGDGKVIGDGPAFTGVGMTGGGVGEGGVGGV